MNPLPPQAYTKDTMVKAYAWLQNQNEKIKELATSPDVLVSLYLKAKLNGEDCLDRPSIQNFKSELKNLAGMMGEFEPAPIVEEMPRNPSAAKSQPAPDNELDFRSSTMIREVKNEFNLSSDQEALRLLISVGYKKLKNLS
jgi:hypothetical protein